MIRGDSESAYGYLTPLRFGGSSDSNLFLLLTVLSPDNSVTWINLAEQFLTVTYVAIFSKWDSCSWLHWDGSASLLGCWALFLCLSVCFCLFLCLSLCVSLYLSLFVSVFVSLSSSRGLRVQKQKLLGLGKVWSWCNTTSTRNMVPWKSLRSQLSLLRSSKSLGDHVIRDTDLLGLRWGQGGCISNKLLCDAHAASSWTTLWESRSKTFYYSWSTKHSDML